MSRDRPVSGERAGAGTAGVTVTVSIEVIVLVLPIEGYVEGEFVHTDQEVTIVVAVQLG